jgi:asparagine synthase (glutamine-hydrolysing)
MTNCATHGELLASIDLPAETAQPEKLVDVPGEFWIAIENASQTTLVASRNGTRQCFYTESGGRLFYGASVADVVDSARLAWRWNWRAVAALSYFGHTLGNDTLHESVHRLGPGEVVTSAAGKLTKQTVPPPRGEQYRNPQAAAVDALVAFVKLHGDGATLPLSAGFDSRLLLAAFLAAGHKPEIFVMGNEAATDARIATAIARDLGLSISVVGLPVADYVNERDTITRVTSGTKTPDNWHTYVGTKHARIDSGGTIFPGANGEYARTFYFDRGWLFHAANVVSPVSIGKLWRAKLKRHAELPPGSNRALAEYFEPGGWQIFEWLMKHYGPGDSLGSVMARFYLRERVRTFIANGLALYDCFARLRLPFLDAAWINAAGQLPSRDKLHSNWHRYAISRLCPKLLDYPTDETSRTMGAPVPLPTRVGLSGKRPTVSYAPNLLKNPEFRDVLRNSLDSIGDVVDVAAARAMVDAGTNSRSIAFLGSLAFWRDYLQRRLQRHGC